MQHLFFSVIICGIAAMPLAHGQSAGSPQGDTAAALSARTETPAISFHVIRQRKINLGDHAVFLNQVVPPFPPVALAARLSASPAAAEASGAERAELPMHQKKSEVIFLSAVVLDHQFTEICGTGGGQEWKVVSNIDFNLFGGAVTFSSDDTIYSLLLAVRNETTAPNDSARLAASEAGKAPRSGTRIPPDKFSQLSPNHAQYLVVEDQPGLVPGESDLAALDALHTYYDANSARIADDYARREAARVAQEQWLKEHPPKPKDAIISYWIGDRPALPEKSRPGGQP